MIIQRHYVKIVVGSTQVKLVRKYQMQHSQFFVTSDSRGKNG
jgi:hypothetical protein